MINKYIHYLDVPMWRIQFTVKDKAAKINKYLSKIYVVISTNQLTAIWELIMSEIKRVDKPEILLLMPKNEI